MALNQVLLTLFIPYIQMNNNLFQKKYYEYKSQDPKGV